MTIEFEPQYTPMPPPASIDKVTAEWVSRELQNIHYALRDKVGMHGVDGAWFDSLAPMATGKTAAGTPAMATFNTTWQALKFAVNDAVYLYFHINHDIKRGSLVYPHVHWAKGAGTDVNSVKWQIDYTVAKGHNQEAFPATTTVTVEGTPPVTPWWHMISEVVTGSAFTAPEVDSVVIMKVTRITNGGTNNGDEIFGLFVDLHYQMERTGTINKAPNFYER